MESILNKKLHDKLMAVLKYYNLKELCDLAEVHYGSVRNFKSNPERYPLSDEVMEKLLQAIKEITKKTK